MTRWPDGPSCGDNSRETFPLASEEEATIPDRSAAGVPGISTEPSHPPNGECRPRLDCFLPLIFSRVPWRTGAVRRLLGAPILNDRIAPRLEMWRRPSGSSSRKTLLRPQNRVPSKLPRCDPVFVNIHPLHREAD